MSLRAPTDAGSSAVKPNRRRLETWACVVIGIAVGWFYFWSALQPGGRWEPTSLEARGYYPLQTAGFRAGHLYSAAAPLPALLALKDPYDPAANTPYRIHDMSLRQGHYYLYFGVTPILVLFWPVAAITGRYPTEAFAVAFFCSAAIWVGMGLLLAIRRRHFPLAPFAALLAGWVCLAWATPLGLLVEDPRVYQVPISCAVLLQALMLSAVYRALHSRLRPLAWMALSGLLFGLSVGARPNYISSFVVLLVPIVFMAKTKRVRPAQRASALATAALCTFLPAAACGFGLLAYNAARFGSPSEFGIHFQLAADRVIDLKAISPRYLFPHLANYLFNPGHWDSYFPFFSATPGQPYGLLRYIWWSWLAVFAALGPGSAEPAVRGGRTAVACALAGAALANLALLACFFGTTYRYPGDFANAEMLLAGMGALALGQRAAVARREGPAVLFLSGVAAASLFIAAAVYVGVFPAADRFLGVARVANGAVYAWKKAHGASLGGLQLDLKLPERPPQLAEPLVETGRQEGRSDLLGISYLPRNRARISFAHAGMAAMPGKEFDIPANREIVVEARFGSLLPPFSHPVFSGWSRSAYDIAKRNIRITVDGVNVLRGFVDCYEASPASTRVGKATWTDAGTLHGFSGLVLKVDRLAMPRPPEAAPETTKPEPIELSLFLPALGQSGEDPLFLTGKGGESDLLYCIHDGAGHATFALDHHGAGGPRSRPVTYDPLIPHSLVVWMGSMAVPAASIASRAVSDRLIVALDGRTLLNIHASFYPPASEPALVGQNPGRSTEASPEFTGEILGVRGVAESMPPLSALQGYGSIDMTVDLPLGMTGTQEPLVVTGIPGAGDFVYVRYVDAGHIAIGFDHWGVGGLLGDPIEVDYRQSHRIQITFPSLYPVGSRGNATDRVRVFVDGMSALSGNCRCFPSSPDRVQVGTNLIGGSTCGVNYTGNVLGLKRISEPSE